MRAQSCAQPGAAPAVPGKEVSAAKFIDVELEGVALENILRKVGRQETRVIP